MAADSAPSTRFDKSAAGAPRHVDPRSPVLLGSYRVLRHIGRGGMGAVLEAEDVLLGRKVALKILHDDLSALPEARERFFREARAAARLKHDNVVTIYQVGEDGDLPYLAMELLRGTSLETWLCSNGTTSVSQALALAKCAAKGLAAGLVHRDVKPANLWLEAPNGRVKILDFGLARLNEGEASRLTQSGVLLGTPAYMAPEQARGIAVAARADLFSLGCVLYRLTVGRPPFEGETIHAVLLAVVTDIPKPVCECRPEVPLRLGDLIHRLLAKNPGDRPPSAQAVLAKLQAIEREWKTRAESLPPGLRTTIDVGTTPPGSAIPPRDRRRRLLPAASAIVLTATVAFIGIYMVSRPADHGAARKPHASVTKSPGPVAAVNPPPASPTDPAMRPASKDEPLRPSSGRTSSPAEAAEDIEKVAVSKAPSDSPPDGAPAEPKPVTDGAEDAAPPDAESTSQTTSESLEPTAKASPPKSKSRRSARAARPEWIIGRWRIISPDAAPYNVVFTAEKRLFREPKGTGRWEIVRDHFPSGSPVPAKKSSPGTATSPTPPAGRSTPSTTVAAAVEVSDFPNERIRRQESPRR